MKSQNNCFLSKLALTRKYCKAAKKYPEASIGMHKRAIEALFAFKPPFFLTR
jgi:hypothetical protein